MRPASASAPAAATAHACLLTFPAVITPLTRKRTGRLTPISRLVWPSCCNNSKRIAYVCFAEGKEEGEGRQS